MCELHIYVKVSEKNSILLAIPLQNLLSKLHLITSVVSRVVGFQLWSRLGFINRKQAGLSNSSPGISTTTTICDRGPTERFNVSTRHTLTSKLFSLCKEGQLKTAIKMLEVMDQQNVRAYWAVYSCLLQACAKVKALEEGKQVHTHMLKSEFKADIFLGNVLISMYAKGGSLVDAYRVFQTMPKRDIVSWNAMVAGYALQEKGQEAVDCFWQMQRERFKPNRATFISILSACVNSVALDLGKQLHSLIKKARLESDVAIGSALITMYCKCGSVEDARQVFNKMPERNVVSWTAMIAGYAQQGYSQEAILLFRKLRREGTKPNEVTFISILGACASAKDLEQGKLIHTDIKLAGLEQEVVVGNALISMYTRCESVTNARQVFDKMSKRDVISWNAMMSGFAQAGHIQESFQLFRQMQENGFELDGFTYIGILGACTTPADLEQVKQIHTQILRAGLESHVSVGSALVSVYASCGSLADARDVFDKMPQRNVVSWNAMIAGYARHTHQDEVFKLFRHMQQDGVSPDHVTFTILLNACASPEALEEGRTVHSHIVRRGLMSDVTVTNSLVSMYARCGNLQEAREVFYRIPKRDVTSWNAIIAAYVQHGRTEEALELFKKFLSEGGKPDRYTFISVLHAIAKLGALDEGKRVHGLIKQSGLERDVRVATTLISMYSKCESLGHACRVFDSILERNVVSWNAIVAAYAHNEHGSEALKSFWQMQREGFKPDKATFTSALSACASLGALEHGEEIHSQIEQAGLETDVRVGNALVDMYAKCGNLVGAHQVFNRMLERDVVSWNHLIAGYAQHGQGKATLLYYEQMRQSGVKPNKATFVFVMSACSQLGRVEEGYDFLESMSDEHSIEQTEEHFCCMVEILGRAGMLKEAEEFIEEMPLEPDASVWGALFAACSFHKNVELAEFAAECQLDLDPESSSAVCEQLLGIYAAAGRWEDVAEIKRTMEETGVQKVPKCSWIEVNKEIHTFCADGRLYPEGEQIHAKLDDLTKQMKGAEILQESRHARWQEAEDSLSHYPEMLATAFSLINTPPGTPIRTVTNFRMSASCHTAAKSISLLYSCGIFVRDASRFHHFENGACTCGDYW